VAALVELEGILPESKVTFEGDLFSGVYIYFRRCGHDVFWYGYWQGWLISASVRVPLPRLFVYKVFKVGILDPDFGLG
jgi:hypothetical protein